MYTIHARWLSCFSAIQTIDFCACALCVSMCAYFIWCVSVLLQIIPITEFSSRIWCVFDLDENFRVQIYWINALTYAACRVHTKYIFFLLFFHFWISLQFSRIFYLFITTIYSKSHILTRNAHKISTTIAKLMVNLHNQLHKCTSNICNRLHDNQCEQC